MSATESDMKIRPYKQSSDYQPVFDLVYEAGIEPWSSAYCSTFNGNKPLSLALRSMFYIGCLQLEFPGSFLGPLFYEVLLIAYIYGVVHWYPTW